MSVYHLRIWNLAGTALLFENGQLPSILLTDDSDPPAVVVEAIEASYGLDVAFLSRGAELIEVEVLGEKSTLSSHSCTWQACGTGRRSADGAPWMGQGWLQRVSEAVDTELERLGKRRTGRPIQVRHWPLSAVISMLSNDGTLWLKAVPSAFSHEGATVEYLGRFTKLVPRVVVARRDWWLSREFPAQEGWPQGSPYDTLVDIQRRVAEDVGSLRNLGCPDRRLDVLASQLDLLRRQASRDDSMALAEVVARARTYCESLMSLGLPDTIVHGDIHMGNARWTRQGWFLFDWTDACISHPFMDLAPSVFLAQNEIDRARVVTSYLSGWDDVVERSELTNAVGIAMPLAAAHRALTYQYILDRADVEDREVWSRAVRRWVRCYLDLMQATRL